MHYCNYTEPYGSKKVALFLWNRYSINKFVVGHNGKSTVKIVRMRKVFFQNKTKGEGHVEVKNKKKKESIIQVSIGVLAVILAILIIIMMGIVSDIQGTARIVNYTGLVRGETQRLIKNWSFPCSRKMR